MTWSTYLSRFHHERAGITEGVLSRCRDRRGATPYEWLAELVGGRGTVLDLGCGNAPLWPWLAGRGYVGVDRSAAELSLAASRGAGPLVRADAAALPAVGDSVRLVVCAMALMLLEPLPRVLAEITRMLRPGGRLVAIIPAHQPLTARDAAVAAGLVAAVGRLTYPNDAALADPAGRFAAAGCGWSATSGVASPIGSPGWTTRTFCSTRSTCPACRGAGSGPGGRTCARSPGSTPRSRSRSAG